MAPPTPPIGLVPPLLSFSGPRPVAAAVPVPLPSPVAPVRAPLPAAPDSPFSGRAQSGGEPRPTPQAPVAAAQPRRLCAVCNAPNDEGVRYCNACGTKVSAPVPSATVASATGLAPTPAPPPGLALVAAGARTGPAPAPAAAVAISPVRVLDVVPSPLVNKDTTRVCGRCRGACDAFAQFCKFCGASLADAPLVPSQSGSAPVLALRAEPPSPAAARAPHVVAPVGPEPMAPGAYARSVPSPVGKGRLVIVARDGGEGPCFPLHDIVDIGRSEGSIVIAEDGYLSPRHVRIFRKDGKLFARDLGSTNGFYLRLSATSPLADPLLNGANKHARLGSVPPPKTSALGPGDERAGSALVGPLDGASFPLKDQDLFLVGQQVIRFEVVRDGGEGLGPAAEHGTLLFGTPAAPRYARLSQRTVEGVTRDVFYIRKRETVFGRESGDIVFTEDPFLSRRHAAIRVLDHGRFALCDLGSSNGTFLQVRGEVPLFDTDQFRVGQQLFRVDLTQDAPEAHVGTSSRP